jgi:hypothetical protein
MTRCKLSVCKCADKDCKKSLKIRFGMGYAEISSIDVKGRETNHIVGRESLLKLSHAVNKFLKEK